MIDVEVRNLIGDAYKRTVDLIKSKKAELEIVAKELLEKEIIFQADLERLIGKRPFEEKTTYDDFVNSGKPSNTLKTDAKAEDVVEENKAVENDEKDFTDSPENPKADDGPSSSKD